MGKVVGERGLYARRGQHGMWGWLLPQLLQQRLRQSHRHVRAGHAIGQPSTTQAAGLEFPHRFTYHVRLHICSQHTPHVNKSICLVSYLSLIRCGETQSLDHREEFIHTVSVSQTWIVYRKIAKHLEHAKPSWNALFLSGSQPEGERRIEKT